MRLTDTFVRKVKKPGKYADGRGLYLLVTEIPTKLWRQKYRFSGVEKTLAHGIYPAVPLAEARKRRDAAREAKAPAERARLPVPTPEGLQPRPVDQAQASLFERIFKEEITGVEVLHSQSERAQHLNRHGALGITSPALKRWLDRWMRGGGIALR